MGKIVIVDDDEEILRALEVALTTNGYEVETSPKSNYLLEQFSPSSTSLIILDALLSGDDGRRICQVLKNQDHTKKIPVLMISAYPQAEKTSLASGADSFLAKPFDLDDFLKVVKIYVS